jgi:hypothetical protein
MLGISPAQVHLALNHLPVVGALLASVVLVLGALVRNAPLRHFGLGLLVFAMVAALPVYFSGEPAEERIEHLPGVSEQTIEHHEDAALTALIAILVGGSIAGAALLTAAMRRDKAAQALFALALVSSVSATALLARAAHLGGQIRHDELRTPANAGARLESGEVGSRTPVSTARTHDDDDD